MDGSSYYTGMGATLVMINYVHKITFSWLIMSCESYFLLKGYIYFCGEWIPAASIAIYCQPTTVKQSDWVALFFVYCMRFHLKLYFSIETYIKVYNPVTNFTCILRLVYNNNIKQILCCNKVTQYIWFIISSHRKSMKGCCLQHPYLFHFNRILWIKGPSLKRIVETLWDVENNRGCP